MKGFALGTLALVVAYLAVKPGTASAAQSGGNILVNALQRLLSPDVAGIPQRRTPAATTTAKPSSSTGTPSTGTITV